jgi:DNA-nicking Smr family endonuclease
MDFGNILDRWDKLQRDAARAAKANRGGGLAPAQAACSPPDPAENPVRSAFESWLDEHDPEDKDAAAPASPEELRAERQARVRRFEALDPEASIDLHGMSADQAEDSLTLFLEDSGRRGLQKVLVVHGKGNHSAEEPVLGRVARRVIESSPWAGRFGSADRAHGGSGALWVAIRQKNRP